MLLQHIDLLTIKLGSLNDDNIYITDHTELKTDADYLRNYLDYVEDFRKKKKKNKQVK